MRPGRRTRLERGRPATSPLLRVLATWLSLLLTASALGQTAHFLLVPHTICAEHGELLELGETPAHAARATDEAATQGSSVSSAPSAAAEHDHCQVLARGQRQQALPRAAAIAVLPAAPAVRLARLAERQVEPRPLAALALAPKTSPPRSSCG